MSSNIKRYLPENMAKASDAFTQALLKAINNNDENVSQLIQACIDQLFLSTANGRYLMQLGEQEGFTMPANSGLDIRAYRVLAPLMVSAPKQVRRTIDEMLQAFYGNDRTRPSVTSAVPEPYSLTEGDNLVIETESGKIDLGILATQVSDITALTAGELAAVLNTIQNLFSADTVVERSTNLRYLRISSKSEGASAFVRVAGGTMQNVLQFPERRETTQVAGTTWLVTKDAPYTDITRFTWDGAGVNPSIYLVAPGDVVSIRGLVDGVDPLSRLNGSFEIIDAGYDYFVVRNSMFVDASATFTQDLDTTVFFTSSKPSILFDRPEYALTGETEYNTATVTVPAIPPLARRFLAGSAHLHGYEGRVTHFTRSSITVELPAGIEKPAEDNAFVLANRRNRYDFTQKYYRTVSHNGLSPTTYTLKVGDDAGQMPFTSPTLIGVDPIYSRPSSDEFVLTTEVPHGLMRGWGFTLAGAVSFGNITSGQINTEHVVTRVIDAHTLTFRIQDANGNYVRYVGHPFGPFDVYRHTAARPDQSDFYLEFPSAGDLTASGLVVDSVFRLDPTIGTVVSPYYAQNLRYRDLRVVAIDGARAHIRAGFGPGTTGLILTAATGLRDGQFGGGATTYMFDISTPWNDTAVMDGMTACFMAATEQANPAYISSYLYDPSGADTTVTASRFVAHTTEAILKGSNSNIVFVDKVTGVFKNEDFPSAGQVVIGYGTDHFEGPIRYNAVIANQTGGPSQIILDPSYRFKNSHPAGAQIQYSHAAVPYLPGTDGVSYPFYLTGTAQARNTLFALLELLVAAGVFLQANVLLPELMYEDPAVKPFS